MAQPVSDWNDFNWFIQTYIPKQTIPILKSFINILQTRTSRYLGSRPQERKADLVARVANAFTDLKTNNSFELYRAARLECEAAGTPVSMYRYNPPTTPAPTFGGVPQPGPSYGGARYPPAPAPAYAYNAGPSSSNWQRTDSASSVYARAAPTLADWKASPMWKPIKAITNMEFLPDIAATENSHVRKDKKITFSMPADVCEMLQRGKANPTSSPSYSLRLFCSSSDYYRPPNERILSTNSHITNRSIPIEYPSAPDIRVDDLVIPFKERGLRGKAGSAPPFDLNKSTKGLVLLPGRLASVMFGHTGPTTGKKKDQAKRFFFQIVLVEWTSKETLQKRLANLPPVPLDQCLEMMRKSREEDDDIEVGSSRMSLKDPLSYMRITRPVRSKKCGHQQCFDATWWIESNAVHPQWLCPLCNKELNFDDLIVDGFFLSILDAVNDSVEEVILESDGEWHTDDDKYGSLGWMTARAFGNSSTAGSSKANGTANGTNGSNGATNRAVSSSPAPSPSPRSDSKGKRKAIEILSSDDEDDTPLSRTNGHTPSLPPSLRPSAQPRQNSINGDNSSSSRPSAAPPNSTVIDLTLSDDDDEEEGETNISSNPHMQGFRHPDAGLTGRSAVAAESYPPPPRPSEVPLARPTTSSTSGRNESYESRYRYAEDREPSVREYTGGSGSGSGGFSGSGNGNGFATARSTIEGLMDNWGDGPNRPNGNHNDPSSATSSNYRLPPLPGMGSYRGPRDDLFDDDWDEALDGGSRYRLPPLRFETAPNTPPPIIPSPVISASTSANAPPAKLPDKEGFAVSSSVEPGEIVEDRDRPVTPPLPPARPDLLSNAARNAISPRSSETDPDQSFYTPPSRPASTIDRFVSATSSFADSLGSKRPISAQGPSLNVEGNDGVSGNTVGSSATALARRQFPPGPPELHRPGSPSWHKPVWPRNSSGPPALGPGQLRRPSSMTWEDPLDHV